MKEIIMHGRGGQGTVVAGDMLANTLAMEDKWVASFPSYGPERRGAPVDAFIRFDDQRITRVSAIQSPDCLIVLDRMRAINTPEASGVKSGGILVLNVDPAFTLKSYKDISTLAWVDATTIALQEIKRDIGNSIMLGALARVTGWVSLEALYRTLSGHFKGPTLEMNRRCLQRGFDEVVICEQKG